MKPTLYIAAAAVLTLFATGCATKKYVAQTVAPIQQKADAAEAKNNEQDQKLSAQAAQIESVDRDLSRTKERLTDTDAKAAAAGDAARQANAAAMQADNKAQGAQQTANTAKSEAEQASQGVDRLGKDVNGMMKFKTVKSGVVLFALGQKTLDDDARAALDDFAKNADGQDRFVIEVQGFTDRTGDRAYNDTLSQERAEAVARYLANQHNIPLHNITLLGSGIASGDQKTRDERKQSRKVELRLLVPEVTNTTATASN